MTNSESGSPWQPPSDGANSDDNPTLPSGRPRLPDRPSIPATPPRMSAQQPAFGTSSGGEMAFGTEPSIETRKGRGKLGMGGAVVGVLALGAAGVFAVTQIAGGNDGGAETPEAVGVALMASIEQEDVLGVIDLLLPGERETFRDPMVDLVGELSRLEVLSPDASLTGLSGLDIEFSNETVAVAATNVADISNINVRADGTASLDGEQLPVGDFILDTAEEFRGEAVDLASVDEVSDADLDLTMTVVEEDGRWFLSLFHTVAEQARKDVGVDIPATPIEVRGGDSPEGAIDALLDGVEQFDLAKIVGALNPNEARALQRYASIFLDDAEDVLADMPVDWQVTDAQYEVMGSGSKRFIAITSLRIDGEADGASFSIVFDGQCAFATFGDDRFDSCETSDDTIDLDEIFSDAAPLEDMIAEIQATFADYEAPGITVREVDGEWFVSPIGAGFDQLLAVLAALDRSELDRLVDQAEEAVDFFTDEFGGFGELISGEELSIDDGTTFPDDQQYEDWARVQQDCLVLGDPSVVAQCLQDQIASGVLPAEYLPIEIEFAECGLGVLFTGQVDQYEQSDEDYLEMATSAAACFADLVERGEIDPFEVPPEYVRLDCAEGRNPWSLDYDDDFFDRWLDCIYE